MKAALRQCSSLWAKHSQRHGIWSSAGNYVTGLLHRSKALFRVVFARRKPGPVALDSSPQEAFKTSTLLSRAARKWVWDSQAAHLRRETARRYFAGGRHVVPTLGLIGICVVKEPTLLTSDEQLESVCLEIRRLARGRPDDDASEAVPARRPLKLRDLEIGGPLGKGCNAVVYSAKWKDDGEGGDRPELAVKMMFNYDADSNAAAIWNSMNRECVPARINLVGRGATLPPHPNIVRMPVAFVDATAVLPGAHRLYPEALPPRLYRRGYGRNATLFLVMKRYHCTLRDYLSRAALRGRTAVAVLCQVLEGVVHMNRHRVAHRDLKTDNLLVDLSAGASRPRVAVADFGCCLAGNPSGLRVPYTSGEVCRDGNPALMAPEVAGAVPGLFSVLDYDRADLWAVGTLAYEIYGAENPFYGGDGASVRLDSRFYREEDLPDLPRAAPPVVRKLVRDLLRRDPSQRPAPALAATVCQMLLYAPLSLLLLVGEKERAREVVRWLCLFAARTRWKAAHDPAAFRLALTFLARVDVAVVLEALRYVGDALGIAPRAFPA